MKRAFLILLVAAAFLSGLVALYARAIVNPDEQQKSRIIKRINASSAVQIYADNSQGSSLYIQEASVKEISGDDFITLVGENPRYFQQTTFPEVTLLNNSSKTIKSFAVIIQSAVNGPKSGHILFKKNLSIPPNSTYKVDPSEWPQDERISVQNGDKFITGIQKPGLDSPKSWMLGAASDLRITVGLVEFEDGTKWKISPYSGW